MSAAAPFRFHPLQQGALSDTVWREELLGAQYDIMLWLWSIRQSLASQCSEVECDLLRDEFIFASLMQRLSKRPREQAHLLSFMRNRDDICDARRSSLFIQTARWVRRGYSQLFDTFVVWGFDHREEMLRVTSSNRNFHLRSSNRNFHLTTEKTAKLYHLATLTHARMEAHGQRVVVELFKVRRSIRSFLGVIPTCGLRYIAEHMPPGAHARRAVYVIRMYLGLHPNVHRSRVLDVLAHFGQRRGGPDVAGIVASFLGGRRDHATRMQINAVAPAFAYKPSAAHRLKQHAAFAMNTTP